MKYSLMLVMVALLVAACGGGSEDGPLGEELFNELVVGGKAGCTSCHSIDPGADGVGPSLAGIGGAAGSRVTDVAADEYLRKSITDPDSYVVEGYNAGIMPSGWDLSDGQIDSLVEYLLGL